MSEPKHFGDKAHQIAIIGASTSGALASSLIKHLVAHSIEVIQVDDHLMDNRFALTLDELTDLPFAQEQPMPLTHGPQRKGRNGKLRRW